MIKIAHLQMWEVANALVLYISRFFRYVYIIWVFFIIFFTTFDLHPTFEHKYLYFLLLIFKTG